MARYFKRRPWQPLIAFTVFVLLLYLTAPWISGTLCNVATLPLCGPASSSDWDLFYHLGGNGPWIPKLQGVAGDDDDLPDGCKVTQVHMLSRHAERYPTTTAGIRHLQLLDRMKASPKTLRGSLAFVRDWKYFTTPGSPEFDDLTSSGPYAGTTQAFNTGMKLRNRYDHILTSSQAVDFWSCDSGRDIETARRFADGFFGGSWETNGRAKLHIISESPSRGGDTLTPGHTCRNYVDDTEEGHNQGYYKLDEWQLVFAEPIKTRLSTNAPGIDFSPLDIYSMMEMCGFEVLVRGSSPWCGVFTHSEWLDFEYGRDLLHFYRAGPGNKYAGAMGSLWLEATQKLLSNNSASGVYFSFAHDGDLIPLMATLGFFKENSGSQTLPTNHNRVNRTWRTSDIVPMGGRVVFERIDCQIATSRSAEEQTFVRLEINDGHIAITSDVERHLLRYDARLGEFEDMVQDRKRHFGGFREVCGLDESYPDRITFLHQ